MCRWLLKAKIKILKSFCSNLIKIRRSYLLVLNIDVCVTLPVLCDWERGLEKRLVEICLLYTKNALFGLPLKKRETYKFSTHGKYDVKCNLRKLNVGLGKGNAVKGKVTQTIYVSTLEKW